jgi:3-methyladenine DNA glycosylase AlkD
MDYKETIKELESLSKLSKKNLEGLKRFGIKPKTKILCVSVPDLRKLAKHIGKNHKLALEIWDSKIHEARILASMIDEPEKVSEPQMEKWVKGFDSWDVCDQVCMNLFDKTKFCYKKIKEWSSRKEEFVKRTAFSLMAAVAFHRKDISDDKLLSFFPIIKKASIDERNFVKKSVNWALRQIGKRNILLNLKAIKLAEEIKNINSKSARWIANNALRELKDEKIIARLK